MPKTYYCVGNRSSDHNLLPGISSIEQFLSSNLKTPVELFEKRDDAMQEVQRKARMDEDSYNAVFTVIVPEDKIDRSSSMLPTASRQDITILEAELVLWRGKFKDIQGEGGLMKSRFITQAGIKQILNEEQDHEIYSKSERVFNYFDATSKPPVPEDKKALWQSVETHTYLLIESLLQSKTPKHQMIEQLAIMNEGLQLTRTVLTSPNSDNVQKLKDFVEKKAPGKTNHWKIWGGVLLSAAAVGLFVVAATMTGLAPALSGALGISLLGAGIFAHSGRRQGVAEPMGKIVSEEMKKPKGPTN